jgi:hypothetical protein
MRRIHSAVVIARRGTREDEVERSQDAIGTEFALTKFFPGWQPAPGRRSALLDKSSVRAANGTFEVTATHGNDLISAREMLMNPSSVGITNRTFLQTARLTGLFALIIALPLGAVAGQANYSTKGVPVRQAKTLLLVRDWNPQTGTMIAWMPMHQVTIELEMLGKPKTEHFNRNDAIRMAWPRHLDRAFAAAEMNISPPPRKFDGQDWVPVKHAPNLVIIAKRYFLIRKLVFGEGHRTLSAQDSSEGFMNGQPEW